MSFADLAADSAVRRDPDVPGRYHLELTDHWDYLMPSGGYVMTAALRAGEAELADPMLRLASATIVFASPIRAGAATVDVHVIRRGKSTSQLRVTLRNDAPADRSSAPPDGGAARPGKAGAFDRSSAPPDGGAARPGKAGAFDRPAAPPAGRPGPGEAGGTDPSDAGVELIATWVRDRHGPDVRAVAPPMVKSVGDAVEALDDAPRNPHARFRFYQQLESRIADGPRFWAEAFDAGPGRYARWFRYRVPQRDAEGRLDRLALPPILDTMPTALHRAIGPGAYRFYAPSLDLTLYAVDDTPREWLLVAVELERARMGWAVARAQIWDDEGRLVAHGSQAMYLHTLSGEPPIVDARER